MLDGQQPLTQRQRQVLEKLDRRVPIKVIAGELSISESRVNQLIRSLKQRFDANDLSELVARYRETTAADDAPLRKPAYRKSQLPHPPMKGDQASRDAGELVLADAMPFLVEAPWARASEPQVVPGVLDGNHAVIRRLALMLVMACGMMAGVVLVILGAVTIGDVLDGVAKVPAREIEKAG